MKQKFVVTGMTCTPLGRAAQGAPRPLHLRGRIKSALAPRFCLRQNACTGHPARGLLPVAEQSMPEEVLL